MTKINDIYELVALWPTPSNKNFALDIGVKERAVADMKRRNTIDQVYLWDIYRAAQNRNINLSAEQIIKVMSKASSEDEELEGEIAA